MMETAKSHWDRLYAEKQSHEVSWTQEIPQTSLAFIQHAHLSKSAQIIDIGSGDSKLVDYLIEEGYEHITLLDISEVALAKAKQRLGIKANKVNWIVSDINDFIPTSKYDYWHDRATFHFLTAETQIHHYLETVKNALKDNGYVSIGTFSTDGPEKCSGLPVRQYDEGTLGAALRDGFKKLKCVYEDHITPFKTKQNFLFCSFKRETATDMPMR